MRNSNFILVDGEVITLFCERNVKYSTDLLKFKASIKFGGF